MKVLHFEDDKMTSILTKKVLAKNFPEMKYVHVDSPYCACPHIALEQPDLLICDYQFEQDTLVAGLLSGILKFKGTTYILSACDSEQIKREVPDLPHNVKFFTKIQLPELVKDIKERIYG